MKQRPSERIKEQENSFNEKFKEVWNSKHSEFIRIPDGIKGNILDWHKSSSKALLEAVIEMAEGMKKELELVNEGTQYEAPRHCYCISGEGECGDCVTYEYNRGLSDLQVKLKEELEKI